MGFMGFLGNKLQTILMYFEMILTKLILYLAMLSIFFLLALLFFLKDNKGKARYHSSYSWVNLESELSMLLALICWDFFFFLKNFIFVCNSVISFLRSWSSSCNIMGWEGCT